MDWRVDVDQRRAMRQERREARERYERERPKMLLFEAVEAIALLLFVYMCLFAIAIIDFV